MTARSLWLATLLVFTVGVAPEARAEARGLEELNPETALRDLKASEGLVFVDLYAEW